MASEIQTDKEQILELIQKHIDEQHRPSNYADDTELAYYEGFIDGLQELIDEINSK